jgi:hypothetical protein
MRPLNATITGLKNDLRDLIPTVKNCMGDWSGRGVLWHHYSNMDLTQQESVFLTGYFLRHHGWPIHVAQLSSMAVGSDAPEVMRCLENVCLVCETAPQENPAAPVVIEFRLPPASRLSQTTHSEFLDRPIVSTLENLQPQKTLPPIFVGAHEDLYQHLRRYHTNLKTQESDESKSDILAQYACLGHTELSIFSEQTLLHSAPWGSVLRQLGIISNTSLIEKYNDSIHKDPFWTINTGFQQFRERVKSATLLTTLDTSDS